MKFHLPGGADALGRPRGEAALTSAERRARVNGGMCSARRLTIGGADALVRPRGEAALTSAERRARVNGGMCSARRLTIGGADALVRPRDNAALTYAARSQLEDVVDERTPRIGHGEVVGAIRLAVDVDVVLKHVGGLLRAERRRRLRGEGADEVLHFLPFTSEERG